MINSKLKNKNAKLSTQNTKLRFCYSKFVPCAYFAICTLLFVINAKVYALDLDKLKSSFLSGDYKSAITEGEKILSSSENSTPGLDELYLILGQSYMKDGNLLRAADIFQIIINEYNSSPLKEQAKLSLADTYFLRQDLDRAKLYYEKIINDNPNTELKPDIYYRLSEVGFRKGDTREGKEYLDKLKQEFPSSPQLSLDKDLSSISGVPVSDLYYTVQVGYFSKIENANNLTQRLVKKGYPAYTQESASEGKISYRVRVGKTSQRPEIVDLENKLSKEGYPTKIFP
jgi:tetratricopeptide (TPR) repeat protein